MRENRAAFARHRIVPRMLRGAARPDTSVELFGRRLDSPFLLAPVGVLELAHREADVAVARAARATGVPMIFSNQASRPMEECAEVLGDSPRWFQLYWSTSDDLVESLVARAEACGCEAIVLTLDTTIVGWRPRDLEPAFLPFLRGQGHRAVHERPGVPPPDGAGLEQRRDADAAAHAAGAAHAGAADARVSRAVPARTCRAGAGAPPCSASRRSSRGRSCRGRTCRSCASARSCRSCSRASCTPTTRAGRSTRASTASSSPTTAAARSTARSPRSTRCRAWSRRPAARSRCCSTPGCAAAPTRSRRSRSAPPRSLIGRSYVYGLAVAGEAGVREVLENLRAELDITLSLAGCHSLAEVGPETLRDVG